MSLPNPNSLVSKSDLVKGLRQNFYSKDFFSANSGYKLLPFRFERLENNQIFATNLVGEFIIFDFSILERIIHKQLDSRSPLYGELISKHFIIDETSDVALDLLSAKYRTRYSNLSEFTGLHMFVVSLRCEHSCPQDILC